MSLLHNLFRLSGRRPSSGLPSLTDIIPRELLEQLMGGGPGMGTTAIRIGGCTADDIVTVYIGRRNNQTVAQGICSQTKSTQVVVKSCLHGNFMLTVRIYENDEAVNEQTTFGAHSDELKPVTLLRLVTLLEALPVLRRESIAAAFAALHGSQSAVTFLTEQGLSAETIREIVTSLPEGIEDLVHKAAVARVAFDKVEVTEALRAGLSFTDVLEQAGIETPATYDARIKAEAALAEALKPHFLKLLRHLDLDGVPGGLEGMQSFAIQLRRRNHTGDALLVGAAGVLFTLGNGYELNLSGGSLTEAYDSTEEAEEILEFVARRFRLNEEADTANREAIYDIVKWWDVTDNTTPDDVSQEANATV